jgi:hypothetical protein
MSLSRFAKKASNAPRDAAQASRRAGRVAKDDEGPRGQFGWIGELGNENGNGTETVCGPAAVERREDLDIGCAGRRPCCSRGPLHVAAAIFRGSPESRPFGSVGAFDGV